jgi:MFS transporter, PPP family, 3-phenylpropionic acid transporter
MMIPNNNATKYSIYYFFSLALLGFKVAYFPLYCKDLGFSESQIAFIGLASTLASIIGVPLILQICHHLFPPQQIVSKTLFLSLISLIALYFSDSFYLLLALWFISTILEKPITDVFDVHCIREDHQKKLHYSQIRIWGSIGFIVSTTFLGFIVSHYGTGAIYFSGLGILVLLNLLAPFCSKALSATVLKSKQLGIIELAEITKPFHFQSAGRLIAIGFFIWASHSCYYVFFSLYLKGLHWNSNLISLAWNIGTISEIAFFYFFPKIEKLFSLRSILLVAIVLTSLRWLVIGTNQNVFILLTIQTFHAFSFGASFLCLRKMLFLSLPENYKDRGQGFLTALGMGPGQIFGQFLAGISVAFLSIPQLFICSGLISSCALIFALKYEGKNKG